jgi:hypothetical protein
MLDRRAPPVDASLSAPYLSPSLCPVGQSCWHRSFLPRARSLSLSRHPHLSAIHNLPPMISPPWTRPRPCVLRPHPCARAPFELRALLAHLFSLICALCQILSPSLSLCPREQRAPPSPADDHCLFRGRRRARAPSSATVSSTLLSAARDTLRCALSLPVAPVPCSPEHFLRSQSPPPSPRRTLAPPPLLRDASASARGEQPARALNLVIPAL